MLNITCSSHEWSIWKVATDFIFTTLKCFVGSTPVGTYKLLVEYCKRGKLSFKYVKTFNMDEYVGEYAYVCMFACIVVYVKILLQITFDYPKQVFDLFYCMTLCCGPMSGHLFITSRYSTNG